MKKRLIIMAVLTFFCAVLYAATPANASVTAKPADKPAPVKKTKTAPVIKPSPTPVQDESYRYYPAYVGDTLYLKARKTSEPDKDVLVKAQVIGTEKKEDGEYFYFYGPKVNVRYLIGIDKKEGVSMRLIKYPFPIFNFSVEVDIVPKMTIIKYPLEIGQKWHYEGKGKATFLFIPIERDLKADFEVAERVTKETEAGLIDAYHLKVMLDSGDGKGPTLEQYWYAKDIGYAIADTTGHKAEIVGFKIFDETTGKWNEKLPVDAEKYE